MPTNNIPFKMYKFRTMNIDSPEIATHLLTSNKYITSIGYLVKPCFKVAHRMAYVPNSCSKGFELVVVRKP